MDEIYIPGRKIALKIPSNVKDQLIQHYQSSGSTVPESILDAETEINPTDISNGSGGVVFDSKDTARGKQTGSSKIAT